MEYKLGDFVKTVNGFVASVVAAVNVKSGTYDIKYRKDGDVDHNVFPRFLKTYVPPTRKHASEIKNWDYSEEPVLSMKEYIARTSVKADINVLPSGVSEEEVS